MSETIELDVRAGGNPTMQIFGPAGMEELGMNSSGHARKLDAPENAQENRQDQGCTHDSFWLRRPKNWATRMPPVQEALERVQTSGIVFIDEIDKVAGGTSGSGQGGPDVSRQGVQRDLPPYCGRFIGFNQVWSGQNRPHSVHCLRRFHVSKPSDLYTGTSGRFPIRVEMDSLNEKISTIFSLSQETPLPNNTRPCWLPKG